MASLEEKLMVMVKKQEETEGKKTHWSKKLRMENQLLKEELKRTTNHYISTVEKFGTSSSAQGSAHEESPDRDPDDFSNEEDESDGGDDGGSSGDEGDDPTVGSKGHILIYVVKTFDNHKVLSISVKETWRLNFIKFYIMAKWNINPNHQRFINARDVGLSGNLTMKENGVKNFNSIRLLLRLEGGVGKSSRTKKTFVKRQERAKTHQSDQSIFEKAFTTAVMVNTAPSFSLKGAVEEMSVENLRKFKNYLFKDKSVASTKFMHMHEHFEQYGIMKSAVVKLEGAMEELQLHVAKELEEKFTAEGEDKPKIDEVKEMVSNALAVREHQEAQKAKSGDANMNG